MHPHGMLILMWAHWSCDYGIHTHTRSHRVSRHMCAHKWTHNPASICGHIGVYAQTSMYGHISVPRVCVCVLYIYIYISTSWQHTYCWMHRHNRYRWYAHTHTHCSLIHMETVLHLQTQHGCYTDACTHAIIDPLTHWCYADMHCPESMGTWIFIWCYSYTLTYNGHGLTDP